MVLRTPTSSLAVETCRLCGESGVPYRTAGKFLDLCSASALDHDHERFALRIDRLGHTLRAVRGAGFDFSAHGACLQDVPSNGSRREHLGPGASDSKVDLAMDETVRRQARELADACDALAQLEGAVTLAPRDVIPTAHRAVPDRTQHMGAVIIRDPRLTRARTLSDQSASGLTQPSSFPGIAAVETPQCEQDLTSLAPKGRLIAAQPFEGIGRQVG